MSNHRFSPAIEAEFNRHKIDRTLTLSILDRFNRGELGNSEPVRFKSIPRIDGKQIVDLTGALEYSVPAAEARQRLADLFDPEEIGTIGRIKDGLLHVSGGELQRLGLRLLPYTAYGILNGGSASSYVDDKKNRAFSEQLYEIAKDSFEAAAAEARGKPKGVSPAFIHPDGTPGPSFLELKLRSLLQLSLQYRQLFGRPVADDTSLGMLPVFQMTSEYTDVQLAEAFSTYSRSPLLRDLDIERHPAILSPLSARQPLIAAYTHSSAGTPKGLFTRAWGRPDSLLPLPGGHGQNFAVLTDIYQKLRRAGKRFAYLGNVDNLGNTINLAALAIMALSGSRGGFEFSYKTAVDIKGGVLVRDQQDRLNAADIGPAISKEELLRAEKSGVPILFNCATGIFDLEYLSKNVDFIAGNLPTRFSDQNKDAGRYSQAEQITWEVIGMLKEPLILAVDKYKRFLASKLLMENLMTSGIGLDNEQFPSDMKALSGRLYLGLQNMLKSSYGMRLTGGRWEPVPATDLAGAVPPLDVEKD